MLKKNIIILEPKNPENYFRFVHRIIVKLFRRNYEVLKHYNLLPPPFGETPKSDKKGQPLAIRGEGE